MPSPVPGVRRGASRVRGAAMGRLLGGAAILSSSAALFAVAWWCEAGLPVRLAVAADDPGPPPYAERPEPAAPPSAPLTRTEQAALVKFRAAGRAGDRLAALVGMTASRSAADWPEDVRWWAAMGLLRGELEWSPRRVVPRPRIREVEVLRDKHEQQEELAADGEDGPRHHRVEAHQGEPWMRPATSGNPGERPAREARRDDDGDARVAGDADAKGGAPGVVWRLRNPLSREVGQAVDLLRSIPEGPLHHDARAWLKALACNNAALAVEVPGAFPAGHDGRFVLDVSNAATVRLTVYRLRDDDPDAEDTLLRAAERCGADFVFRDYGMHHGVERAAALAGRGGRIERPLRLHRAHVVRFFGAPSPRPLACDRVWGAELRSADLPALPDELRSDRHGGIRDDDDDDGDGDPDREHFEDDETGAEDLLRKPWRRRPGESTSWLSDRIATIPAEVLRRPGALVMLVQAGPVRAWAPLIVGPPSVTLRRCRDGVVCQVGSPDGRDVPARGAALMWRAGRVGGLRGQACDATGLAFARVRADGARPLLVRSVEADGTVRRAVAGFGPGFDGVWRSAVDEGGDSLLRKATEQRARQLRRLEDDPDAGLRVFADRMAVGIVTDAPSCEPGGTLRFRLIVRRLGGPDAQSATSGQRARGSPQATTPAGDTGGAGARLKPADTRFRFGDFDEPLDLRLPETGSDVRWTLTDARGKDLANGDAELSSFGTAAAEAAIPPDAARGAVTMTVRFDHDDVTRRLGRVAVVHEWSPTGVSVALPDAPTEAVIGRTGPEPLVTIEAVVHGGGRLPEGRGELWLRAGRGAAAGRIGEGDLDERGRLSLPLRLPDGAVAGDAVLLAVVRDSTGRTAQAVRPIKLSGAGDGDRPPAGVGSDWPSFVRVGEAFVLPAAGTAEVVARRADGTEARGEPAAGAVRGRVALTLPKPGWWAVTAGSRTEAIFAAGGDGIPCRCPGAIAARCAAVPGWVRLDDDRYLADRDVRDTLEDLRDRAGRPGAGAPLFALMPRSREGTVGGKLPVLLWTPAARPVVLLSLEGRTVIDAWRCDLRGGSGRWHAVEVPLSARCVPDVFLRGRVSGADAVAGPLEPASDDGEKPGEGTDRLRDDPLIDDDGESVPEPHRIRVTDPSLVKPREGTRLAVSVTPAAETVVPGARTAVDIRVTDAAGRPVESEVSLAAVDEEAHLLADGQSDDGLAAIAPAEPPRRFRPKTTRMLVGGRRDVEAAAAAAGAALPERVLQKRLQQLQKAFEQLAQNAARLQGDDDARPARPQEGPLADADARRPEEDRRPAALAGELPVFVVSQARLRERFPVSGAWLPSVLTDKSGRARAEVSLPDTMTAWRLTAVAVGRGPALGTGHARVHTRRPLMVQVVAPRVVFAGQRTTVSAVLVNPSDAEVTARWTWHATHLEPDPAGSDVGGEVRIPARGQVVVPIRVRAARLDEAGEAGLCVLAGVPFPAGGPVPGWEDAPSDAECRRMRVLPRAALGAEFAVVPQVRRDLAVMAAGW